MDELAAFRAKHKVNNQGTLQGQGMVHRSIPHLNQYDELVIPFNAETQYYYWSGGKKLFDLLNELNVSDGVMDKYVDKRRFH